MRRPEEHGRDRESAIVKRPSTVPLSATRRRTCAAWGDLRRELAAAYGIALLAVKPLPAYVAKRHALVPEEKAHSAGA